jgi:hypothetical protein
VLDGEVVASDADGRPNFVRLHERWTRPGTIHLWAFDILAFNGRDLRAQPLVKRQGWLAPPQPPGHRRGTRGRNLDRRLARPSTASPSPA